MNLQARTDGEMAVVSESIDIIKMYDSTTMRYIGGEFTSLSSVGTNDYEFAFPGKANNELPTAYKFGLVFGTPMTNPANVLTSTVKNTFNGIGLDANINSAYFGQSNVDFNSGNKGSYKLDLTLSGSPENVSAYLGYVTLNFVEIETTDNIEKPVNSIEHRCCITVDIVRMLSELTVEIHPHRTAGK